MPFQPQMGFIDFNMYFATPVWTDIVQAVAAVFAAIGTVGTFIKLLMKNDEMQSAIINLEKMAAATSDTFQLREQQHLLSIRPTLKLNGQGHKGCHEFHFNIKNIGHDAYELRLEDMYEPKLLNYLTSNPPRGLTMTGETEFKCMFNRMDCASVTSVITPMHFQFTYKDIEGNRFKQELRGDLKFSQSSDGSNMLPVMSEPILLERRKYT